MQIVNVDKVSYGYDSELVLDNISFTVNEGDFLGIIGPNGAGKTTLFRLMAGLRQDYHGQITIFYNDIQKNKKALQYIGYLP